MKSSERAYCAGLLDGEGCISYSKGSGLGPTFRVSVKMTEPGAVRWLAEQYGLTVSEITDPRPNNRMCFQVQLSGSTAKSFLKEVRPYLKVKTEQANAIIRCNMHSKAARQATADRLRELNRRGTHVDVSLVESQVA